MVWSAIFLKIGGNTMATAKKLPSGSWRVQVLAGYDASGKKIQKSFTAPTKWEAEKMADEYKRYKKEKPTDKQVGKIIDEYIEIKSNVLSPTTIRGYKAIRATRLQSIMGEKLSRLTVTDIQRAVNDDSAVYSAKSLRDAYFLLVAAVKRVSPETAACWNITLPAKKPVIKQLPRPEDVFQAIKGTEIELPCLLAMWLSLRMSEVRGLKFTDVVDGNIIVQRSKLYVNGEDIVREINKTYNSTRILKVPEYILNLIELKKDKAENEYIVPLTYGALSGRFARLMKKYKYKISFHDLRHINASVMVSLGIPDKYAMERGGWSTDNVLKSVYQHTFSEERKLVDEAIDKYFNNIVSENSTRNST